MISRNRILEILEGYDLEKMRIGVLGSHSALDVCDGAREEGFRNLIICQAGREKTYTKYFKNTGNFGLVDDTIVLPKFKDILKTELKDILFIPNRSFACYVGLDDIEEKFEVPIVGSRNLLRSEDRGEEKDYYWLMEKANLPHPEKIEKPEDIDSLTMVKLPHAQKRLERCFFTCSSYKEFLEKSEQLLKLDVITREDLENARIEKYIIGVVFNLDFFYSPIHDRIELLGIDNRYETSLDGHVRLPAGQQITLNEEEAIPEYIICGHNSITLRESLLEKVFPLAEKYVEATKELFSPGIIGPFCIQTCIDKELNFYIYDIAPRIGGGTNVHVALGHAYGNALWRESMSTGRRVCREIKEAMMIGELKKLVT